MKVICQILGRDENKKEVSPYNMEYAKEVTLAIFRVDENGLQCEKLHQKDWFPNTGKGTHYIYFGGFSWGYSFISDEIFIVNRIINI